MDFTNLLVGFEFEFTAKYDKKQLMQLLRNELKLPFCGKKSTRWEIHNDSSVEIKLIAHAAHELVSPPQPYNIAIQTLHRICNWMKSHDCRTNSSTGLHVSMSFKEPELNTKIDPIKLIVFTPSEILNQFKRQRNYYCMSYQQDFKKWSRYFKHEAVENWQQAADVLRDRLKLHKEKYRIVNINKLYEHQYVEFRAVGNKNYHQRIDEIYDTIKRLAKALLISVDSNSHVVQYKKAIESYMNILTA